MSRCVTFIPHSDFGMKTEALPMTTITIRYHTFG